MISIIKYFLVLIIVCVGYHSHAQNHLSLVKYRSGKQVKLNMGESIKVKSTDSSKVIIGVLDSVFLDSIRVLLPSNKTVSINKKNIDWIMAERKTGLKKISQILGKKLLLAGPLYLGLGAANNIMQDIRPTVREGMLQTSAIISITGAVFYTIYKAINYKRFNKDKWKIQVNNYDNLAIKK